MKQDDFLVRFAVHKGSTLRHLSTSTRSGRDRDMWYAQGFGLRTHVVHDAAFHQLVDVIDA